MVVTEQFLREATVQRAALGADAVEPVVIDHPLSTLSDREIDARATQAVEQVVRALTAGSGPTAWV